MEGRGHSRMGALLCLEVDIDTSLIYLLLAFMMPPTPQPPQPVPSLENIRTFLLLLFFPGTTLSMSDFSKVLVCD